MSSMSSNSVTNTRAELHSVLDDKPEHRITVNNWGGRSIRDIAKSGIKTPTYTLNELARKVEQLDKAYYANPDDLTPEAHIQDRVALAEHIVTLEKKSRKQFIEKTDSLWLKLCWRIRNFLGRIGFNRDTLLDKLSHVSSQEVISVIAQKIPDTATFDRLMQSGQPSPSKIDNTKRQPQCSTDPLDDYIDLRAQQQGPNHIRWITIQANFEVYGASSNTAQSTPDLSWRNYSSGRPITYDAFKKVVTMLDNWLSSPPPPTQ